MRRHDRFVAALFQFGANENFQGAPNRGAFGRPQRQAGADFGRQHEQTQFAAQLAMVARFGFFEARHVFVQLFLRRVTGAIQTLQLRVVGVAAPEGAGDRQQFDGFDAARRRQVRAATQIEEIALTINRDRRIVGQGVDKFGFIRIIGEEFKRRFARNRLAGDGQILFGQFHHLRFDCGEIVLADSSHVDVVVVTVFERRADGEFGVGIQFLNRLRH